VALIVFFILLFVVAVLFMFLLCFVFIIIHFFLLDVSTTCMSMNHGVITTL
jgi:hypothetical protein